MTAENSCINVNWMPGTIRITDGQLSFIGGVDSGRTPTIASENFPEGLKRTQLSWATNAMVRGGGVSCRYGWKKIVSGVGWEGIYQGGFMYEPDYGNPYLVLSIGGQIYRVRVDSDNSVQNISQGNANPPDVDQAFFVQAERFLVIQAGDYVTLPLFWDGEIMRRSVGLEAPPSQRELPAAGPMDYYMGRIWYAQGRQYSAGDIVDGPSGTLDYERRDSVLKVTENPLALGGDGFIVPTQAGNIRALTHTANLDSNLGISPLYVMTRKAIYAAEIPVNRSEWATSTELRQRVVQKRYGTYGDRCVVPINGDLFYQSPDGIRSLFVALRHFTTWGNTPISSNENRVLFYNNRELMRFASGIEFDNRLLQLALPVETPKGVAFKGIIPLDFDLISTLQEKLPPAWEGMLEGLDILQLFEGDFGGLQRAFAVVVSRVSGEIEVWELTLSQPFDVDGGNVNRITWIVETPAYNWGIPFEKKRLDGLELWVDRMIGDCVFTVFYRPDQNPCWFPWHSWQMSGEIEPCSEGYPVQTYCQQFRANMVLPVPKAQCDATQVNPRPTTVGFQFQVKIEVTGFCRIRGILIHARRMDAEPPFDELVC